MQNSYLKISFHDHLFVQQKKNMTATVRCKACYGRGATPEIRSCAACQGFGKTPEGRGCRVCRVLSNNHIACWKCNGRGSIPRPRSSLLGKGRTVSMMIFTGRGGDRTQHQEASKLERSGPGLKTGWI